jgi:hypothetical protein
VAWALLPGFWLVAREGNALWWLAVASLVGGMASNVATTAASKLITRLPPAGDVAMYVAVSGCVGSFAGGMGGLAAGLLLQFLQSHPLSLGGHAVVSFHVLFAASLLLRFSATGLIGRIGEGPQTAGRA